MMRALMTKTLFILSILLSAQALAFDVGGLSYTVIPETTNVEVIGRAVGNSDTDIVIPASVLSLQRAHCHCLAGRMCCHFFKRNNTIIIIQKKGPEWLHARLRLRLRLRLRYC